MRLYVNSAGNFFTILELQQGTGAFQFEVADSTINLLVNGLIDVNYELTDSETLVFTKDPNLFKKIEQVLKDTSNGDIIYILEDGTQGLLQEGTP